MNGHIHHETRFTTIGHQTTLRSVQTAASGAVSRSARKRPADEFLKPEEAGRNAPSHPSIGLTHAIHRTVGHRPHSRACLTASAIRDTSTAETDEVRRTASLYSPRRAVAATPTPAPDPLLNLAHPNFGLPERLVHNLASLGVHSIYSWQAKCLLADGLLKGEGNLTYVAPTGGGKSLVSDILMLKKVIENRDKKAILVLPYVALVQEKLRWLRRVVEGVEKKAGQKMPDDKNSLWRKIGNEDSIRIAGLVGGSKSRLVWADVDIVICTIEKANSLVNTAIEQCTVGDLGVVVMDELHMLDDDQRGYILELMATKILSLDQDTQLIGMSATLPNVEMLARWLNSKFYISNYCPVPIQEFLVFDGAIYPASTASRFYKTTIELNTQTGPEPREPKACRLIEASEHPELRNSVMNAVVSLAVDTARAGYCALVFCSSRKGCETDARLISYAMPALQDISAYASEKRNDLLCELRSTASGLDSTLEQTIPFGVGFHHAGLTTEEREIVSRAYDDGILKVIVATCSLSAGINLPARRVILHGARMGRDLVAPSMLRQMRGRAGRKGKDEIGETFICCQKSDLEEVAELMEVDIPNVMSSLSPNKRGIERALLEVIATRLATSTMAIYDYIQKTLLHFSMDHDELNVLVKATLDKLAITGLIRIKSESDFEPTLLGQAIVASSLTPEDGIFVHRQLQKAAKAFVLDGEMHVLYTFTPIQPTQAQINWCIFRQEIECLDESGLRVLGLVGIKQASVNRFAHGAILQERTPEELENAHIYRRFYAALQLRDLCNEMPIHAVARKYQIPRGSVQTLAQTCHGFAAGMIKFSERKGWGALAAALDHMSDRLKAGARSDLLALAQVTYIKSRTARVFWENGYKTVGAIATARPQDLVPVLLVAQPKKLHLTPDDDEKYQKKLMLKAEVISKSANRIWELLMQQEIDEE